LVLDADKRSSAGTLSDPDASDGVTNEWEACALRHETAHINGWPPSHPNAHYEGATLIDTIFR
jgi:hypothetical protein